MGLTPKQKIKVSTEICELYKTDKYDIESCCDNTGIAYREFKRWVDDDDIAEIAELYIKAKEEKYKTHRGSLKRLALTSFEKKLKGWEYEEVTIEGIAINDTGTIKGKKIRKTKKLVIPGDAITIFALKNLAGYRDKQEHDITLHKITDEDRDKIIQDLNE